MKETKATQCPDPHLTGPQPLSLPLHVSASVTPALICLSHSCPFLPQSLPFDRGNDRGRGGSDRGRGGSDRGREGQ